mgnify:CR=1 FL=1
MFMVGFSVIILNVKNTYNRKVIFKIEEKFFEKRDCTNGTIPGVKINNKISNPKKPWSKKK